MTDESTHAPKVVEESFQKTLGLTMAAVATVFSIISWAAGKYSSMQSGAEQKVAYMHDWYNAKGIKQRLAEGQRDLLIALMKSGTIAPDKVETLQVDIDTTNANIARYKKEKKEMTLGSKAVGRENWAQDIDGVLGRIEGTKELERKSASLAPALERFQTSYLFFQLSLFAGSVSLMSANLKMKRILFWILIVLGAVGTGLASHAWISARAVEGPLLQGFLDCFKIR
jgi:uncharacterized protein YcfL